MCRPPSMPANVQERAARRSVPATFVGCVENGMVTISYKEYKRKIRTTETMEGKEFVRRFMLHIVPRGVHRVRYGGFFHGKGRTARLDECRKLQNEYNNKNNIHYYSSQTPAPEARKPGGRNMNAGCVSNRSPRREYSSPEGGT